MRKRDAIGDRAVAGGARGKLRGPLEGRAGHERLDALVHIAEALLEPHHRFAARGETEMSRLDDAGMHRPDRDLMQAFAFNRQEGVGGPRLRRRVACAERMLHVPEAEIEPRPGYPAPDRLIAVETVDGALQPDRRRMQRADRRKVSVRAGEAHDRDVTGRGIG